MNAEKGVNTVEEALEGARHIVAEGVSENAEFRKAVRQMMMEDGVVVSRAIEGVDDPEQKYKMYADYREPASKIPSHRMLAIRRGAKEGILTFEIELDPVKPLTYLKGQVVRAPGEWVPHLEPAVEDAYDRLLNPSIQTEVRLELKDRSDEEAIQRLPREPGEPAALAARGHAHACWGSTRASAPAARWRWWTRPASSWKTR